MKRRGIFALIALALFASDFLSKYFVVHNVPKSYYGIAIFQDFFGIDFCINHVTNTGGAWGMFSSYQFILLGVRVLVIATLLIYALFFNRDRSRSVPFLLILTGAVGNIFDTFYYGAVIDMLHFTFWGYSYPVFNIADSLIFLGVAAMLIHSIKQKRKHHDTQDQPSQG